MPAMKLESSPPRMRAKLPQAVIALGLVSFFTDLSSEMIYPLLPVFLAGVLGAGAFSLGLIEGVAETTAAVLKVFSGIWSDRLQRRRPFILAGYGLSSLARPLIGLARAWPFVLLMRFADRVGKGLRSSPRDALIANATPQSLRGRAYGLHRAMDHAGAVAGPLVAAALMSKAGFSMRQVFLMAALPGIAVMGILLFKVKESAASPPPAVARPARAGWRDMSRDFRRFLLALIVFTLGNSTDAFLLLYLAQSGIDAPRVALLWSLHHVVKMVATYAGGRASDRIGRRAMITGGWLIYAAVYAAFAFVPSQAGLIAAFLIYGLFYGLTEPAEKAWVADLAPARIRGAAFGYYHGGIGVAALPASLIFGLIWHRWGAAPAFLTGAALALLAVLLLSRVPGRIREEA